MNISANRREEKNQKMKSPPIPSIGSVISLRQAAQLLQDRAPIGKKGLDVQRLLDGLRQGKIHAAFMFSGDPLRWVTVSPNYWAGVTTQHFETIRQGGAHDHPGVFTTRLKDHAEQFVQDRMSEASREPEPTSKGWIVEALLKANTKFEVQLIKDDNWDQFVRDSVESARTSGSLRVLKGSGRHEKDWKLVYRALTAHLATKGELENISDFPKLADAALAMARQLGEGKLDLPTVSTVVAEIQALKALISRK
jgi:hypothetical protein